MCSLDEVCDPFISASQLASLVLGGRHFSTPDFPKFWDVLARVPKLRELTGWLPTQLAGVPTGRASSQTPLAKAGFCCPRPTPKSPVREAAGQVRQGRPPRLARTPDFPKFWASLGSLPAGLGNTKSGVGGPVRPGARETPVWGRFGPGPASLGKRPKTACFFSENPPYQRLIKTAGEKKVIFWPILT